MLIVIMFDTALFVTATFYGSEDVSRILVASLISKASIAVVYSVLLTGYLLMTRPHKSDGSVAQEHSHDIFHILTYKQRFELLEEEFKRDGLTGLFNRRFFDENMLQELNRAKRLSHSLNLVLLDIDHFKTVNDTHGHHIGDEIIKALADSMQTAFRAADIPCRYGGEEFAIVMPDSSVEAASLATGRLQAEFTAMCVARNLPDAGDMTFTAGIANYPKDADTVEELIVRADQRLYRGKESGRNQVMFDTVIMKALVPR